MFTLSYHRTKNGLIPRLEFDAILALDFNTERYYDGVCRQPMWSLLPHYERYCDATESIIREVGYFGNVQEMEEFDFDTIYSCEVSEPEDFEKFFEDFGVWEDGDPEYEEPRELVGVLPYSETAGYLDKPLAAAIKSSRGLRLTLEHNLAYKMGDMFSDTDWNAEIGDLCPDEHTPWQKSAEEVFFEVKIYREYPVVKP